MWLPLVALIGGSAMMPACSCNGDAGGAPACEIDTDCPAICPNGQIGVCLTGKCICTADVPLGEIGRYSDLALSSDGSAWVSAYNYRHGDLMVAPWPKDGRIDDAAWQFVDGVPDGPVALPASNVRGGIFEAGDDVGRYTSIAVSMGDVVMVSYFDKTHGSLKFATDAGGSWQVHTVDTGNVGGDPELGYEIAGQYSSITVRGDDGRPGIAYFAQVDDGAGVMRTELRFAEAATATPTTASDWTTTVVDELSVTLPEPDGADPPPFTIPEGIGLFADATRAPDGSPVIAYYDRVHGDLKLVRFDTTAGVFDDPTVLDGDDGDDVGWYPDVAVDPEGVAHVSYLSATDDDLLYINDADATVQVVDDGYRIDGITESGLPKPVFHFVGDDSAIVVTGSGLAIAYQDATTHELLLAQPSADGSWERVVVAGDEDPFSGGYGFYAAAAFDGTQVIMSNWVIDQPADDSWVEIHRRTVVVK